MTAVFTQYEELLRDVFENGLLKGDRTGTGTRAVFGRQIRFDLRQGFPLVTTKKVHFHSVVVELLWFLRGETNVQWLQDHGVHIWDEWAAEDGELGPVYGAQWRSWYDASLFGHIDQIKFLVETLKHDPNSRRMLVSAWNVGELRRMALEPCHFAFQCFVVQGRLSLQVYQRSCDLFLGVPFNIASYALLTHMLAAQCSLDVGDLVWTGGDCHIYSNHVEQVQEQLSREPRAAPEIALEKGVGDIFSYSPEHVQLLNYLPHPAISAPVAV